jgi:hypothetical protein
LYNNYNFHKSYQIFHCGLKCRRAPFFIAPSVFSNVYLISVFRCERNCNVRKNYISDFDFEIEENQLSEMEEKQTQLILKQTDFLSVQWN